MIVMRVVKFVSLCLYQDFMQCDDDPANCVPFLAVISFLVLSFSCGDQSIFIYTNEFSSKIYKSAQCLQISAIFLCVNV